MFNLLAITFFGPQSQIPSTSLLVQTQPLLCPHLSVICLLKSGALSAKDANYTHHSTSCQLADSGFYRT